MRNIQAFFDGACGPINPGGRATWGFVVLENDELLHGESGYIGDGVGMTNNVAEYWGLIACLRYLKENHSEDFIEVFGDSSMVINMTNRVWGRKNPHKKMPHLVPLVTQTRELLDSFDSCSIEWVPREENQLADDYSKREQ